MFQDFSHFAGCFLMLFVAAMLGLLFIEGLIDRLTKLVYVWRFPTEVKDIDNKKEAPTPATPATEASTK
jgi:hypothetical protein